MIAAPVAWVLWVILPRSLLDTSHSPALDGPLHGAEHALLAPTITRAMAREHVALALAADPAPELVRDLLVRDPRLRPLYR